MAIKIAGTEVINDNKRVLNNESLPDVRPSLLLDFANSKTLDPRITFTRGSTATYWDGKTTAKAEENLLTYSQDATQWGSNNSTITGNTQSAPDGTTTADTYESLGDTGELSRSGLSVSAPFALSIFVKYVDTQYFRIRTSGPNTSTWFDIQNGTIATDNHDSSSITDVGNGWYRLTVSENTTDITAFQLYLHDTDNSLTEVAGTVYVWGAQLEQRSSATAYTATTTSPIVKYQPVLQTAASGEARFDHDPVTGESKGLLIEETRTNLATYSEDFDQWTAPVAPTAAVVTDDTIVSPDGNITGAKVDFTASDNHPVFINATISLANGADMTNSLFVKYGGGNLTSYKLQTFSQGTSNLDGYAVITFNSSGVITSVTTQANVTSVGYEDVGNGWYRVHAVQNNTTGGTQTTMRLSIGRGASDTGFIYVWGGQIEAGSFPTSYIPTSGSTVTRVRDEAYIDNVSFINPVELTIYVEAEQPPLDDYRRFVDVSGSSITNSYAIFSNPVGRLSGGVIVNGVTQASPTDLTGLARGTMQKAAAAIAENDFAFVRNGSTPLTDTSVPLAGTNITRIWIGNGVENYNNRRSNNPVSKIAIYPKRLPNATLQAMTEA